MNISQASEASGLPPDTIRFYERKGVLPRPPRQQNGYRDYTTGHISTLRLAKGLRSLDVPLSRVDSILTVAHDGTCGDIRELMISSLSGALRDLRSKIRDLDGVEVRLTEILGGLEKMEPDDTAVPGLEGCDCMRMASTIAED
jgi:DNA-binding transcriptional MerR regulator